MRSPSPAPFRVLVVDDHRDAADSLVLLLAVRGYDARAAYDGPAALELAGTFRPQAALLDIGLPGLDGCEVARRLRRLPGLEDTLLVATTGSGQPEDRRRCHEAGFDAFLLKPFDLPDLEGLLAAAPGCPAV